MSKPKKKAPKKGADKKSKDKKPKFHIPPKGQRCEAVIIPLKNSDGRAVFHEKSFRTMKVLSKKKGVPKDTYLLVACPKKVKGRGMKRSYSTVWKEGEKFVKARNQCQFVDGPKAGEKAGMRAHAKIEAAKNGKCRTEKGYKLTKPKAAKKMAKKGKK